MFQILQDELKNLKLAVENEKGKKGKGKGGKAGKKGKGKKDKKKDKGKKGKKEKDPTANRTMESLIEEIVQAGILQRNSPIYLNSFLGEFDYMKGTMDTDPVILPSLGEVKKAITEYCILPFGIDPFTIPFPKITSLMLYGPVGSGKSHLVKAIATELGAQIFNLSPRNTAGEYIGKANVAKMVHVAFKVARAQSPSIIYIDGIEMVFAKKVPKDDTSDPKRIKKDLLKTLKLIKDPSEKVIVICTSSKPWDCEVKALQGMFDKMIYCPKPDYSSRMTIWQHYVHEACKETRSINFSILSRSSAGMTTGSIKAVCHRILTESRLKKVYLSSNKDKI